MANYAYGQAYELLSFALQGSRSGPAANPRLKELARDVAVAAAESGGEAAAHEALDLAMGLSSSPSEIAELQYIRIRTLFNYGKINQGWLVFRQAQERLGRSFPKYAFWKWIQINRLMLIMGIRLITGWGLGRDAGDRRTELLAAIYHQAGHILRFRSGLEDYLLTTLQSLEIAHRLGSGAPLARAIAQLALLFTPYRLTRLRDLLLARAKAIARESGIPAISTYLRYVEMLTLYFGDESGAEELEREIGPDVMRYLGPYERSGWVITGVAQKLLKGQNQEGSEAIEAHLPMVEKLGQRVFLANLLFDHHGHSLSLGRLAEAVAIRARYARLVDADTKDLAYCASYYPAALVDFAVAQNEIGADIDLPISFNLSFGVTDHVSKYNHSVVGYVRLAQLERAVTYEEKRRARTRLKEALRTLYFNSFVPLHQCHWHILKAGLERACGRPAKALRHAEAGYGLARRAESTLGAYQALLQRARALKAMRISGPAPRRRLA